MIKDEEQRAVDVLYDAKISWLILRANMACSSIRELGSGKEEPNKSDSK